MMTTILRADDRKRKKKLKRNRTTLLITPRHGNGLFLTCPEGRVAAADEFFREEALNTSPGRGRGTYTTGSRDGKFKRLFSVPLLMT